MSRRPLLGAALVAAASVAALGFAGPASAATYANELPYVGPLEEGTSHCAKVEIVYARGTSEPAYNSFALNGFYASGSGSGPSAPTSIWRTVTRDLRNRRIDVDNDGLQEPHEPREYVYEYPAGSGTATGRSDFALYNLPYPANTTFIEGTSSYNSVQIGTQNLMDHLNAEVLRCPDKKYMLFGYSQGALVVANTISKEADQKYMWRERKKLSLAAQLAISSVGMLADGGFDSTAKIAVTAGHNEFDWALFDETTVIPEEGAAAPATNPDKSWNIDAGTHPDLNGRMLDSNVPLDPLNPMAGQIENPPLGPWVGGLRSHDWFIHPRFKDRVRNYCYSSDPICNRSSVAVGEHFAYFANAEPRTNLAIFAVNRLRADDTRWDSHPKYDDASLGTRLNTFPGLLAP